MMSAARRIPRAAIWLMVVAILLLVLGLNSANVRQLLAAAVGQIRPAAVLATVPGLAAAMLLCAAALRALRPGVSYWGCLASRLLRDGGDNLLVFLPGLGNAIGARALVLAGGRSRAAVTASGLDKLAEAVAQLPYIGLAGFVLLRFWNGSPGRSGMAMPTPGTFALALLALLLLVFAGWRLTAAANGPAARLANRLREEFLLLAKEFHAQKAGVPLAIALHFIAWIMGGLQVWMASRALGFGLSLYMAIAIESAAYAGRAILFFVPAGLVTQEAGLVAAGLVFGLAPSQSLALGLVLRLRDLAFGLPLLAWPLFEYRHARRARKAH